MDLIALIAGLLIGSVAAAVIQHFRMAGRPRTEQFQQLQEALAAAGREEARLLERSAQLERGNMELRSEVSALRQQSEATAGQLAAEQEKHRQLEQRLASQTKELEALQKQLTLEFENLASRILEENSKRFSQTNQERIAELLKPLGEKLGDFRAKVEMVHESETRDRALLVGEIKRLTELNQTMSTETRNLTQALKGESKFQGGWGELVLETILEKAGLEKGREYRVQSSFQTENGRFMPDVVIDLVGNKHIILDAKVSLTAYERYCSGQSEEQREAALKEHIRSIRSHVKELAAKDYPSLGAVSAPDFVLMFVPLEAALALAIANDAALLSDAMDEHVVLVGASTLIPILKTVANLWKQDRQARHALEIAEQAGRLYDAFVGFYDSLAKVGKSLEQTNKAYEEAMGRLKEGRGNLIKKAEDIRTLGAKARKALPPEVLERADVQPSLPNSGETPSL